MTLKLTQNGSTYCDIFFDYEKVAQHVIIRVTGTLQKKQQIIS